MGNNHYLMQAIGRGEPHAIRGFIAWLLRCRGGFAPKLVNPGGVEAWKSGQADGPSRFRSIPRSMALPSRRGRSSAPSREAAGELKFPHPVHMHATHLGLPGNWSTTLETMRALEGHRAHLAHIQFHSYGGSLTKTGDVLLASRAASRVFQLP